MTFPVLLSFVTGPALMAGHYRTVRSSGELMMEKYTAEFMIQNRESAPVLLPGMKKSGIMR
jgi:hypothetical protein